MLPVIEKSKKIAVFCGARPGTHPEHLLLAEEFGTALARRGLDLVYGAGGVGVMGSVAHAVLAAGGGVTGVIPRLLHERERTDNAPGTVFVVRSMHERKALMYRLSNGFAVLPGGFGTLDELMEVATWNQLSIMRKPIVVVNHRGFFDPMLRMLDHLVEEGFLRAEERRVIQVAQDAEEAMDRLGTGHPLTVPATA
ncbi:TIGR00730 family Rossman fold protein [Streptomyces coacervatus]|uniref:Cytokinin riboside 5'-monophosphate phosphoribohydrolase n=1 Tax=Streptomyces coacervatus TaxID=647381 RepID=A0ABP7JEZ6_9ACTN|nr:TIGR00730 family Rossman fold protein [Streptomyces coacervatus]MDF2273411.1 TIGR00730 family Rossman fold protein [Streptomyces coacervatus]